MKSRNTYLTALTGTALIGSVALSQAAVIVSDDFEYGAFSSLFGQNGGTGFSNAWYNGGAGSNIYVAGVALGIDPSKRDLAATIGDTGTLWVSFDWSINYRSKNDPPGYTQDGAIEGWGGLTFFNGGAEKLFIGNIYQQDTWHLLGADSGIADYGARQTAVIEITMNLGATDTARLWVGATGSPVDVSGAAAATVSGFDLSGVGTIRIMGQAEQTFDNLIIGTTMTDVDAIPEPSTALLGGLGMLCLSRRRRA